MRICGGAISFFQNLSTPKRAAVPVFLLYLLTGVFIYKDYGMNLDEPMERWTSLINYVHVMGENMRASDSATIRNTASGVPDLMTWRDRFYGAALQNITILIEHLLGFRMSWRDALLLRHIFTFFNYFIAGICFYLILRRRFGNTYIPLLGTLLYILYPRFFGESFHNIKDMLFYAWVIIAAYFVLRWLDDGKVKSLFPATAALAVAMNTRILGLSLLLLACAFAIIIELRPKKPEPDFKRIILKPLSLFALTSVFYIVITPFLWENPLKNIVAIFSHFLQYQSWHGEHLYLGKMITSDVPWHYIPVWMGVTIPLPYLVLFLIGVIAISAEAWARIKTSIMCRQRRIKDLKPQEANGNISPGETLVNQSLPHPPPNIHLYDLFFTALFFCTLLGYIILSIGMYEGWRHAYGIFCPFLYLAVLGMVRAYAFASGKYATLSEPLINCLCGMKRKAHGAQKPRHIKRIVEASSTAQHSDSPAQAINQRFLRRGLVFAVIISLSYQLVWIVINHPYQYVYFNVVGRQVAEKNFTLDYWDVSHYDLIRYALAYDVSPQTTINSVYGSGFQSFFLTAAENTRVTWTDVANAEYYIQHTRMAYNDRTPPPGFTELTSITVDGMKISTLYKRVR